jgi:ATP phosphoribosyltransferase
MSCPPPAARDRLRVAIQKSGRLARPARELLAACGLAWHEEGDRLFCLGQSLPIDLLLVRDDDIPGLLADGVCDFGIVGRNVLGEHGARQPSVSTRPTELRALGFGACRLAVAIAQDDTWRTPLQLAGKRIATSYPALLRQWLDANQVIAQVVVLGGSVEIAPRLGQADAVCDLVSSGATLAANQLQPVATVLQSEAVLAARAGPLDAPRAALAELLLRRLDGVLRTRCSKLLLFQAQRDRLPALLPLLHDADAPTVYRLDDDNGLALQALCRGAVTWQRLEALERAGARGLMVVPVEGLLA